MSHLPDMPCQELVELITDYVEDALSASDRQRFEAHLQTCSGCREYLAQFQAVIAAAGRLREEDLPETARADLLRAFRGWAAGER